ncbi:MAG TPA: peptidylprolyl isomerase [Ignavibacteriaceae bacterium]|jgi:FKBP-type peptidyl-prolyl cis-trans isomerase SlyD|nr:MAG: FKBP-type peptidyl-prolyl cis-trans isomerase SlyD [Ignavibacteria bacterium ADurb.Bin266]OQY73007.1 MAG: peptidylprolyl isomerase [Ignavibacteriales bacterium UTCHB2]HQF41358.1 peptidylprolyl isomerase [Ignavibacteriaceae bacterium]HQI41121.1 peptidylprolyl isomerase [Ignavibacteriaceae bacterium]HQJ45327.1 peptidylprolyl isomerase [Ignavibacteriaceae bacterium]
MPIEANKVVTLNFTLTDDAGNVLDSTDQGGSFSYISGRGMVLPKLEEAVSVMMIGTKKQLKLEAADAYGNYNDQIVQVVGKENFPEDFVLEVGMEYMASNPEGVQMPFTITEVNGDEITIDFNHPFAGMNLNFDLELLDVRDATAEELAHGHVHGPGGHHHH